MFFSFSYQPFVVLFCPWIKNKKKIKFHRHKASQISCLCLTLSHQKSNKYKNQNILCTCQLWTTVSHSIMICVKEIEFIEIIKKKTRLMKIIYFLSFFSFFPLFPFPVESNEKKNHIWHIGINTIKTIEQNIQSQCCKRKKKTNIGW